MRKLAAILLNLDARVVVVSHPNPKVSKIFNGSGVEVLPPLGYLEMIWMLQKSGMIITDSGGLVEEAAELGVPAVIFREATERIAAVVKGRAVLSLDEDAIAGSLERVKRDEWKRVPSEIFGDGRASGRIADILIDSLRSKP
jgi:UDP-N-acetylglucosamine 2-epimerase